MTKSGTEEKLFFLEEIFSYPDKIYKLFSAHAIEVCEFSLPNQ